jgi:hypothetical protein
MNFFDAGSGHLPGPNSSYTGIIPANEYTGIAVPTHEGMKQILTMPNETTPTSADYLTIVSTYDHLDNTCSNCSNDRIVRANVNASNAATAANSWFDFSVSANTQFPSGSIAGVYPSSGHNNPIVYVLTVNQQIKNFGGFGPGQVWKGQTIQIPTGPLTIWTPAMGSGTETLNRAYDVFVNPYNPNELYAVDLGGSNASAYTIKQSQDGGNSWFGVPQLRDIATNYGEFDFACGQFAFGTYADKQIFGNECPMTQMVFVRDHPEVRIAVLYPGGLAYSRDGGGDWIPLNVTNELPAAQPIELPHAALYDGRINPAGNSSIFVALQGKGVMRVDGPFATLEAAEIKFHAGFLRAPGIVMAQSTQLGQTIQLQRGSDGTYDGSMLFDSRKINSFSVQITINGSPAETISHVLTTDEVRRGVAQLS